MIKRVCSKCHKSRWAKVKVVRIGPLIESSGPRRLVCLPCRKDQAKKTRFFVRTKPRKGKFKKGHKR